MRGNLTSLKTGSLLDEQTLPGTKPFATTCINFMDSVTVNATGSKRTTTEVCPLLIVCQDTGAVYTQVAYDRNTSAFLLHWDHFVAELSRPPKVVSDQGSRRTSSDTADQLDWAHVEGREAERGTDWEFVPAGCQWRNKLAKSRVDQGDDQADARQDTL